MNEQYMAGDVMILFSHHNRNKHGLAQKWYKGELLVEANFVDNVVHGLYRHWYYNGQIATRNIYDMGELVESETWSELGEKGDVDCDEEERLWLGISLTGRKMGDIYETWFSNGMPSTRFDYGRNLYKYWYEDGILGIEELELGGEMTTICRYRNGQIKNVSILDNGGMDGIVLGYYKTGSIHYITEIVNGEESYYPTIWDNDGKLVEQVCQIYEGLSSYDEETYHEYMVVISYRGVDPVEQSVEDEINRHLRVESENATLLSPDLHPGFCICCLEQSDIYRCSCGSGICDECYQTIPDVVKCACGKYVKQK
jgi:antitoxin component YwqK of YwqJK toxin-antitoxin module